jgi:hypothetical protein
VPTITPGTYSVKNQYVYNGSSTANFGLRSSIGEMLSVVDDAHQQRFVGHVDATGVAILDVRGGNPRCTCATLRVWTTCPVRR